MVINLLGLLLLSVFILDKVFIKFLKIKIYKDFNGINFCYYGWCCGFMVIVFVFGLKWLYCVRVKRGIGEINVERYFWDGLVFYLKGGYRKILCYWNK